jgi:hypothetical protein
LGAFSFFCTEKNFIDQGNDATLDHLDELLEVDPLFHRSAGPEQVDQLAGWWFVREFLAAAGCDLPGVPPSAASAWDEELGSALQKEHAILRQAVSDELRSLHPSARAVILSLCTAHNAGVLLPLMLATGRCTPEEYADGLLLAHGTYPWTFDPDWPSYRRSFPAIVTDASSATSYLKHSS